MVKHGYTKVISHTTRPPRPGEVDGQSYYYVSRQEFEKLKPDLIEDIEYVGNRYGIHRTEYGKDKVVVVELTGLKSLIKTLGRHNLLVLYIKAPAVIRFIRLLKRGTSLSTALRRLRADKVVFNGVRDYADYVIDTTQPVEASVQEILKILKGRGAQ